jgi:TonB family protein
MRKAVLMSIGFHALVSLLVFQWVSFSQVNYVPRQVYDVTLVTPAAAAPAGAQVVEPAAKPETPPPPAEEEKKKDEEMPAPPDEPKKKPAEKKEESKKTVPTTEIRKTTSPPGAGEGAGEGAGAEAGAGAADGAISFENNFPFAHYIGRMRQKIAATWRPPGGSPDERSCRVYFRVHRNGSVSDVSVEESSGISLFDQSCQRAVFQSAPLPPLPREFSDEYLGVHFSFLYRETE